MTHLQPPDGRVRARELVYVFLISVLCVVAVAVLPALACGAACELARGGQ